MKTLSKWAKGNTDQPMPQWIEPMVHHYNNLIYQYICFDALWAPKISTLFGCVAYRFMFKREPTSVDTMSCTGYGT